MVVFPTELRSVILAGLWLVTASLGSGPEAVAGQPSATTFWVTADQLMPAWGFYPLQAS